ncbi:class I SAM-dependent methyltransferase [candidate division KSB1 bacterium]
MEVLEVCNLCAESDFIFFDKDHNICRCRSCGYIFDNPRPIFDEIKRFYSLNDKYDSWLSEEKERICLWRRRLRLVKKYRQSGSLLDVGTGIGQFLHFARNDFNVTGTEISDIAVKIAHEKYDLAVMKGVIEELDFNTQFDVITLFHVLEHVPDPAKTIGRCRELLKNDGMLIMAVPNDTKGIRPLIVRILRLLRVGKFRDFGKSGLPRIVLDGTLHEIHLSHFTDRVLTGYLQKNGFEIVSNTLDPFYAVKGVMKIIHDTIYVCSLIVKNVFRANIYPTMWIAAKKRS